MPDVLEACIPVGDLVSGGSALLSVGDAEDCCCCLEFCCCHLLSLCVSEPLLSVLLDTLVELVAVLVAEEVDDLLFLIMLPILATLSMSGLVVVTPRAWQFPLISELTVAL